MINITTERREAAESFSAALVQRVAQAVVAPPPAQGEMLPAGALPLSKRINRLARKVAGNLRFGPYRWAQQLNPRETGRWLELFEDLEWLYARFADDASRQLLVEVVAYRMMGNASVRLPLNVPDYWEQQEAIKALATSAPPLDFGFRNWKLHKFDLAPLGYPIELYSRAAAIQTQFQLRQYDCPRIGVGVRDGDVVIDGGACYGDTALYFAHQAGESGLVVGCEFVGSNLKLFEKNRALNPRLGPRIRLCPHPLWAESGVPLYVQEKGPASTVSSTRPAGGQVNQVATVSIDDLVSREGLERVDFIKLDIEGAELPALRGAAETIRRHRPQLALCVYHQPTDFVRLGQLVDTLVPTYRFSLGHFTTHAEETVLFARNA